MTPELILLLQALVILVLPVAIWRLLRLRHGVPLVCVQILLGIALGPSVFGRVAPELYNAVFSPATLTPLAGIATIAVLLFGYITGLHFEPVALIGRGRAFTIISTASVAIPTAAGFLGGLWIAERQPAELALGVDPVVFAAAIGICIGVTALPVLGAILREMKLLGHPLGDLALGIAAVNDGALWILLGVLMTVASGKAADHRSLVIALIGTPIYLLVMVRYVRPYLKRLAPRLLQSGGLSERALAAVCAVALGSAMITQVLGLHYIFGAFIAGALMPDELRQVILDRLQLVTIGILMPFFFMMTGLRTQIDLGSSGFLEIMLLTTALAVLGKVGGTTIAARLTGETWANAFSLGALVQTKGLMELVVLTILLDRGIISANAFSALTLMAVITTLLAMPLARIGLRWVPMGGARSPRQAREGPLDPAAARIGTAALN